MLNSKEMNTRMTHYDGETNPEDTSFFPRRRSKECGLKIEKFEFDRKLMFKNRPLRLNTWNEKSNNHSHHDLQSEFKQRQFRLDLTILERLQRGGLQKHHQSHGCFANGQFVYDEKRKLVKIESVKIGDRVLAATSDHSSLAFSRVTWILQYPKPQTVIRITATVPETGCVSYILSSFWRGKGDGGARRKCPQNLFFFFSSSFSLSENIFSKRKKELMNSL